VRACLRMTYLQCLLHVLVCSCSLQAQPRQRTVFTGHDEMMMSLCTPPMWRSLPTRLRPLLVTDH
jgi:hypothetical protein